MSSLTDAPDYEQRFLDTYGRGTVVEVYISKIIKPSQIVTTFNEVFSGRLSLVDIAKAMPEAEQLFRAFKVGDIITCVVLDVDLQHKIVKLSQKELTDQANDQTLWHSITRQEEMTVNLVRELHQYYLVRTDGGIYGIIPRDFDREQISKEPFRIKEKLDSVRLLSLIPADSDGTAEHGPEEIAAYRSIDEEFRSYRVFVASLLGRYAEKEDLELIKQGFEVDPLIFSKEISLLQPLYLEFDRNNIAYENNLKNKALPYFFPGEPFNKDTEKRILEKLGALKYWFKLIYNTREIPGKSDPTTSVEFTLYNEEVNIYVTVIKSGNEDPRLVVKHLNLGRDWSKTTERKKSFSRSGAFLFSSSIILLGPYTSLPFGITQQDVLDYLELKTRCLEVAQQIKKASGEILRQEGYTLGIIDRFLEYQLKLLESQKGEAFFVSKFTQIPSNTDGITLRINPEVEPDFDNGAIVNVRVKRPSLKETQEEEYSWVGDAKFESSPAGSQITLSKDIEMKALAKGFYLDKKVSKRNLSLQRDIIKDFLEKKIKLDHIESLLIKPDRIKPPRLSRLTFNNPALRKADEEHSDNNQVNAVKKAVGNQNIFLIQGPPGTGKTTVIAEIIEQLAERGQKILVAGQNHVAVDNVLEKMAKNPALSLLRAGRTDKVAPELVGYCMEYQIEDYKTDFKYFIRNQSHLCAFILSLKAQKLSPEEALNQYQTEVNKVCEEYGRLKDWYRHKHFVLRDSIVKLEDKDIEKAMKVLESWGQNIQSEYEILLKPFIYNTVDVVFATCIGIRTDNMLKERKKKFDTVIIDEAGKASIAETLVAMELGKKVILVGDQMQLPPYMDSSLIDDKNPSSFQHTQYGASYEREDILHALKTSFFEFIIKRIEEKQFPESNLELLNYQHRMHPNIGEFVSSSFYGGKVNMGEKTHLNRWELPIPFNKEIIFFDTSNSDRAYEKADGLSVKNDYEALSIAENVLPSLFEHHVSAANIAIIAPYKSQVANIIAHINRSPKCPVKQIDVSTLDSFQGKEYDIIIFSFTRSADHRKAPTVDGRLKFTKVGFLDDARRLNVAFSRAKKKLILIGNAHYLTDTRSHFDGGLFNYTGLFRRLINLSKDERIGNFINIADRGKSGRHSASKLKLGMLVTGSIESPAVAPQTGHEFGKNVITPSGRLLAPYKDAGKVINDGIKFYKIGAPVSGLVIQGDKPGKLILQLLEPAWFQLIKSHQIASVLKVIVLYNNWAGIKVKTESGITGTIMSSDFAKGPLPAKNTKLFVKVVTYDIQSKTIEFKLQA